MSDLATGSTEPPAPARLPIRGRSPAAVCDVRFVCYTRRRAAAIGARPLTMDETNDTQWYRQVAELLRTDGDGSPHLVIDLDRLDDNVATVRALIAPNLRMRLVQKSLPSLDLLRHLAERLSTRSLMVFHRPYLNLYARAAPEFDLLVGKPLPVAAARAFYDALPGDHGFDVEHRLQWLVDTDARLAQYQELARGLGVRMSIALEIDVGLHRGGLDHPAALAPLLERIAADPDHLRLSGFMGYDAHVAKAPPWIGRDRAVDRANARYRAHLDYLRSAFPALARGELCLNGAGSPSLTLHAEDSPLNEVSFGSALLKPVDFDLPTLTALRPACVIAAPILKVQPGVRIPFLEGASRFMSRVRRGLGQSVFLYGGHWMATPVWPPGMRANRLYGLSSNHQMMNLPTTVKVAPDDVSIWRPNQSEAVLLEFGDLWLLRSGRFVDRWPVDSAR